MGIFGQSVDTAINDEVEDATNENSFEEDWSKIISICDKVSRSQDDAKNYFKAILRRLQHSDPHVSVKAITLMDACVKNCGKTFHIEVASRDFENEFNRQMGKGNPTVAKKLREALKRWALNEFKNDPQLSLIPSLYHKWKSLGLDFSSVDALKKTAPVCKDPNVVETQEEEDQILKAIELSLKENSGSPKNSSGSSSLYPSVNMSASGATGTQQMKEQRKVRALYDFEAAEDNEITFKSGEILFVIDDSDPNWWKGKNQRGEGLFPANFVTADLSVEPDQFLFEKAKNVVQFKTNTDQKAEQEPEVVEINEEKIDRLLHLLHEADPTNLEQDSEEMLNLEKEVNRMGPLIDAELEKVDIKHAQLTQLSADLVDALGLYHTLMREPQFTPVNKVNFGYTNPNIGYNGLPLHPPMPGPGHAIPPQPPSGQPLPPHFQGLPMPQPQPQPQPAPHMQDFHPVGGQPPTGPPFISSSSHMMH